MVFRLKAEVLTNEWDNKVIYFKFKLIVPLTRKQICLTSIKAFNFNILSEGKMPALKKFIGLMVAILMVSGLFPVAIFAEETAQGTTILQKSEVLCSIGKKAINAERGKTVKLRVLINRQKELIAEIERALSGEPDTSRALKIIIEHNRKLMKEGIRTANTYQ